MSQANRDYLVSLGFESNIKEMEQQFSAAKLDKEVDKWATAIKNFDNILETTGNNFTSMMDVSKIKDSLSIFKEFISVLDELNLKYTKITPTLLKLDFTQEADTPVAYKTLATTSTGKIKSVSEPSAFGKILADKNGTDPNDINKLKEIQTQIANISSNAFGGTTSDANVIKEQLKNTYLESFSELTKISGEELLELQNTIQDHYKSMKASLSNAGDVIRQELSIQLDDWTTYTIKLKKVTEEENGVINTFWSRTDQTLTKNNAAENSQALKEAESTMNEYVKLNNELESLKTSGVSENSKDVQQITTSLSELEKELNNTGISVDKVDGKFEKFSKSAKESTESTKESTESVKESANNVSKEIVGIESSIKKVNESITTQAIKSEEQEIQNALNIITKYAAKKNEALANGTYNDPSIVNYGNQIETVTKTLDNFGIAVETEGEKITGLSLKEESVTTAAIAMADAVSKANTAIQSDNAKAETQALNEQEQTIEKLLNRYVEFIAKKNELEATENQNYIPSYTDTMQNLGTTIDELTKKGITFEEEYGKISTTFDQSNLKITANTTAYQNLTKAIADNNEAIAKNQQKQADNQYKTEVNQYISDLKQLTQLKKNLIKLEYGKSDAESLAEAREQVQKLESSLSQYSDTVRNNSTAVKANEIETQKLSQYQAELKNNVNRVGTSFGSFSQKLKTMMQNTLVYSTLYKGLNLLTSSVRDCINEIETLDTSMTEIQMVTNQTDDEVVELMNSYAELGKQLGATTEEVAEGSVEWLLIRSCKIFLIAGNSLETNILTYNSNIYRG